MSESIRSMQLATIATKIEGCTRCESISKFRRQNDYWAVPGEGRPNARVMFIGDAPKENEVQSGRPFLGQVGDMLEDMLAVIKWDRSQVYLTNVLKCQTPLGRKVNSQEAHNCRGFLDLQIKVVNPSHIVCLGKEAARHFLYPQNSHEWISKSIESLRGKIHEHEGRRVICTYSLEILCGRLEYHTEAYKDLRMLVDDLISLHQSK